MADNNKQLYLDFEAYERVAEPHKRERASAWHTAIGLQDVDGLKTSDSAMPLFVRIIIIRQKALTPTSHFSLSFSAT